MYTKIEKLLRDFESLYGHGWLKWFYLSMKSKLYDDRNLLHNFSRSFFLLSWDIFHHPKFRSHSLQETVIGHYFLVNDLIGIVKEEFKKNIWNFPDLVGGWVWKSSFSRLKKIKNMLSKCIKMLKYSFKRNLFFAI